MCNIEYVIIDNANSITEVEKTRQDFLCVSSDNKSEITLIDEKKILK